MTDDVKPSRPRRRWRRWVLGFLAVWLVAELGALVFFWTRQPLPADDIALLYRPHPYRVYMFDPGARGRHIPCSINSHGFRGPEITLEKPPGTVRIACFGGSTTFDDTATTDGHTFPAHMERFLRAHYAGLRQGSGGPKGIEVINAGVPGYTSLESLIHFETKVLDYGLDVAVFHHGLDDAVFMAYFRNFASDYTHARKVFLSPRPRLWERSALLSLLLPPWRSMGNPYRANRETALAQLTLTDSGRLNVDDQEQRRCFQPERIDIFARNVRNFIFVARGHGVTPVLSTVVCSPEAGFFAEVVEKINARLREIAEKLSVPCVDIAQAMPWSAEAFVDRCHLRDCEAGLERKGRIFADYLIREQIVEQAFAQQKPGDAKP